MILKRNISFSYLVEYIFLFGLFSSFVLPPIPIGQYKFFATTIVSPFLFIFTPIFYRFEKIRLLKLSFVILLLGFMVIISNFHSSFFLNSHLVVSDYMEIIKYWQYLPYTFVLPYLNSTSLLQKINSWFKFMLMLIVGLGFIQLLLLEPFLSSSLSIYSIDSFHIEGLYGARRIFTTGSDPNMGGAILFFFSLFLFYNKSIFKGFTRVCVLLILVFLFLNTQSRTSILGAILSIGCYMFFTINENFKLKLIFSLIIIGFFVIFFGSLKLDYIKEGIDLVRTGDNQSLNLRKQYVFMAIYRFFESPILGWGTVKSMHETVIDSEYALILQRYGMLGIFVFGLLFRSLFKNGFNSFQDCIKPITIIYLLFSLVFMSTNNIFSGYQLMSIIILLYSLNLRPKKNE